MGSRETVRKLKQQATSDKPEQVFGWAAGSRVKADAEAAAQIIKAIHKHEPLTPQAVIRAAEPEDSPLHECIEWDEKEAAHKYQEDQARLVLRALVVCYKRDDDTYSAPIRYTVKISRDSDEKEDIYEAVALKKHVYIPLREAMADPDNRRRVLLSALSYFMTGRRKYAEYEELAQLFEEIERLYDRYELAESA